MGVEIERKFLVTGEFKQSAYKSVHIIQGYLSSVPQRSVRIRLRDEEGFITIKGIGDQLGMSRFEWEKEIPAEEARQLLRLAEPGVIDKTRYLIHWGEHTFEVDEFHGENDGLIMAEIELRSEDDSFEKPEWLGQEVTGDIRYYNSSLMKNPFKEWHS